MSSPAWDRRRRRVRERCAVRRGHTRARRTLDWCAQHGVAAEPWQAELLHGAFVAMELRSVPR